MAVATNRARFKRNRDAFQAFVTDVRLRGLVKPESLTFWIEPGFGFFPIAIALPYVAFAMLLRQESLNPEVQLVEVAWMVPLVLFALYFHLRRTSFDRIEVVEPGSVTIIRGRQGVVTESRKMSWAEMRFKIDYGESGLGITMDGPKGTVSFGNYSPNFGLLCDYLLKYAPERVPNGLHQGDEMEERAQASRGRPPVRPWSDTNAMMG